MKFYIIELRKDCFSIIMVITNKLSLESELTCLILVYISFYPININYSIIYNQYKLRLVLITLDTNQFPLINQW